MNLFYSCKKIRLALIVPILLFILFSAFVANAEPVRTLDTPLNTKISDPGFKLVVCDGPALPPGVTPPKSDYVPCDFNGLMMQVQHIINVMISVGVIVAIIGFFYVGWLYIVKGTENAKSRAKDILQKLVIGFVIMIAAWFIVSQILNWLTGDSGFGVLLGS